jgi:hypothetical protein
MPLSKRSLSQNEDHVRVFDSRVVIGEQAFGKQWTFEANDQASLLCCLMGKCASVLSPADLIKVSAQRASLVVITPESNVLTFSAQVYYFDPDGDVASEAAARVSRISRNWNEALSAQGITPAIPVEAKKNSTYPGHFVLDGKLWLTRSSWSRFIVVMSLSSLFKCLLFYAHRSWFL